MASSIQSVMSELAGSQSELCIFACDFSDNSFDIYPSALAERLFGNGSGSFVNPLEKLSCGDIVCEQDRVLVKALCTDLKSSVLPIGRSEHYKLFFRIVSDCPEGFEQMSFVSVPLRSVNGAVAKCLCIIAPMTDTEKLTRSIVESFTNDKHPTVFNSNVKRLLAIEDGRKPAFIQFDIAGFKLINIRYGEAKGTEILNFIVNGLNTICTDEMVHVRLTADVFMVAMLYSSADEIERFINTVQERLSSYEGINYKLVFGVNTVTDKTLPIRKNGDRAAMARQSIKGNALENVAYYSDQESRLSSIKIIEDRMEYALENGEFLMYLQPKYSIGKDCIVGSEALVRWLHPDRGLISPMDFIPVFERNGFIVKLDRYMWEQACKALRSWMDAGREPMPISVNISRANLDSDEFIYILDELTERYRIPKHLLETEITETIENAGSTKMLSKLKEHGYTLLMDDFGSGYSSLNMLRNTPFDVIKIDRDFFSEFMLSDQGKKIIRHTISMAMDLGLDMVAEGVETKEHADFLLECGCDTAQGFYYSRPLPLDGFEKVAFGDK